METTAILPFIYLFIDMSSFLNLGIEVDFYLSGIEEEIMKKMILIFFFLSKSLETSQSSALKMFWSTSFIMKSPSTKSCLSRITV